MNAAEQRATGGSCAMIVTEVGGRDTLRVVRIRQRSAVDRQRNDKIFEQMMITTAARGSGDAKPFHDLSQKRQKRNLPNQGPSSAYSSNLKLFPNLRNL